MIIFVANFKALIAKERIVAFSFQDQFKMNFSYLIKSTNLSHIHFTCSLILQSTIFGSFFELLSLPGALNPLFYKNMVHFLNFTYLL